MRIEKVDIDGVTYYFFDDFADPYQIIEATQLIFQTTREEAIEWLQEKLGINVDFSGTPYPITDIWMTKFNATVFVNTPEDADVSRE